MDRAVTDTQPAHHTSPVGRWTPRGLVVLIEGVLAGVSGVYIATGSLAVTAMAAGVATNVVALGRRLPPWAPAQALSAAPPVRDKGPLPADRATVRDIAC